MRAKDIVEITEYLEKKIESISGTYLITGATGFIGRYTIDTLVSLFDRGYDISVYALTKSVDTAYSYWKDVDCVKIIDWSMDNSFPDNILGVDYLIHTAAMTEMVTFSQNSFDVIYYNVLGTIRCCEWLVHHEVKNGLLLSSGIVYGNLLNGENIKEDRIGLLPSMNPRACYAESKIASEYFFSCLAEQYDVPVSVCRLFSVYGPGMSLNGGNVFSDLYKDAIFGKKIVIKGNGTPVRNFCYISDVITAIFTILIKGSRNTEYNIGSKTENYSIKDLARILGKMFNIEYVLENNVDTMLSMDSIQIPNVDRLVDLGWQSYISLSDGIRRMKIYNNERCNKFI